MYAQYALILPTHLPPLVDVPMSYSGPFTSEMHGDEATPTKQDSPPPHEATHSHHFHLDFSRMPHSKSGHIAHPHNWSSIPHLTWPHHLPYSSSFHMASLTSWVPPADVRKTPDCYLIDIDVPGLAKGDEEKVLVQWLSPRTIIVSAEGRKLPEPRLITIPPADSKIGDVEDGGPVKRTETHQSEKKDTKKSDQSHDDTEFLAHERHSGPWRRSFTLPEDTNFHLDPSVSGSGISPTYTIEAGVLSIQVPRKETQKK